MKIPLLSKRHLLICLVRRLFPNPAHVVVCRAVDVRQSGSQYCWQYLVTRREGLFARTTLRQGKSPYDLTTPRKRLFWRVAYRKTKDYSVAVMVICTSSKSFSFLQDHFVPKLYKYMTLSFTRKKHVITGCVTIPFSLTKGFKKVNFLRSLRLFLRKRLLPLVNQHLLLQHYQPQ